MVPTKERNQSGVLISYGSEGILVDCGEGIQRQLKIAGIKLSKVTKILISHLHGDHVLGLPGLIQSMNAARYLKTLRIYGPIGIKSFMKKLFGVFVFDRKVVIEINEVNRGKFFDDGEISIVAELLEHNIKTLGYSIVEKDRRRIDLKYIKRQGIPIGPLLGKLQRGKSIRWKGKTISIDKATYVIKGSKITIISDTVPCMGADRLAKGSDILICESTYGAELKNKGLEYGHMTSEQAAELAKRNGVRKLILTHFSARYKSTQELEKDAKKIFDNVMCSKDFMKMEL